ncbi:hypothetical protein ACIA8O_03430 [Kitasatospora sp. NPDC051853]|uniref:hypothetical protein n=1 Tax=Kitasatospora sp. NPDC051853 TaxID=3364058 RepID=UPI0037B4286E
MCTPWYGLVRDVRASWQVTEPTEEHPMRPIVHGLLATALAATAALAAGPARATTAHHVLPSPVFGVTIDDVEDIEQVVAAEATLPHRPTTRVVFDDRVAPDHYRAPVERLRTVSHVMGELLDSDHLRGTSVTAYQQRARAYVDALGGSVDVWEIGNEVNGDWTGPYGSVAQKIRAAFDVVEAAGGQTALTLYENSYAPDHCGDGPDELTPVQFSQQYVPEAMRAGLEYVWLSYYPTQCSPTTYPSAATVRAEVEQLHALYPNALIGFGEVGLPAKVRPSTLAKARTVMNWAYNLDPGLDYYVGGYFWWYAYQDAFTGRRLLLPDLRGAFLNQAAALGTAG